MKFRMRLSFTGFAFGLALSVVLAFQRPDPVIAGPQCSYPDCNSPAYQCIDWTCCNEDILFCELPYKLQMRVYYENENCTGPCRHVPSWSCVASCGPPE